MTTKIEGESFKIRRRTMKEVDEAVRRYIERNAEQSYGESFKTVY
jgi:hypothetical protein